MNDLAYRLGVSVELSSYDVYSTYDSDMLTMAPCPVFTPLATTPMTEACRGCSTSVVQVRRSRRVVAEFLEKRFLFGWMREPKSKARRV